MSTPPSTPWVPVWDLVPPTPVPTPVNGKWLGAAGGAMIWQDIPGLQAADTGWTVLTLTNAWVHYADPYGPGRYRKLASGLVVMEGLISTGNVAVAFTLPVGYRPMTQVNGTYRDHIFQCATGGAPTVGEAIRINSNGGGIPQTAAAKAWIDLSGVQFYAGP